MCGSNLMICVHHVFSWFVPPKQFITAALSKKQMPRDDKTGKFVLESVKADQRARLASRTAEALAQLQRSNDIQEESSDTQNDPETPASSPNPYHPGEVTWARHTFGAGNLIIYSRGTEAITIRKAPVGDSWFIDFGDPPQPPTQPE